MNDVAEFQDTLLRRTSGRLLPGAGLPHELCCLHHGSQGGQGLGSAAGLEAAVGVDPQLLGQHHLGGFAQQVHHGLSAWHVR